jgi:hypothetical protein
MNALTGLVVGLKLLAGFGQSDIAKPAWALLKSGQLDEAAASARVALDDEDELPELRHILFNIHVLRGEYESALDEYARIPSGYVRFASLDDPVVNAYRHLGRYQDALAFALARNRPAAEIAVLEKLVLAPFVAELDRVAIVPFAEHPLTPYLPAFDASINGQGLLAHIDTGGNYVVMGPDRARTLGIVVRDAGKGLHGADAVPKSLGVADTFQLGDAIFRNVPVTVLASLTGQQDFVIFGTNILQPFLATMDYPNNRLVLSPRGHGDLAAAHRAMFGGNIREVPFLLWSDHYMLAHGMLGRAAGWFFVDSGLVMIHEWQGAKKQSAFLASKAQYESLGVDSALVKTSPFELPGAIGLDDLPQTGHIAVVGDACPKDLGGVAIYGLLSHAYLKHYAWTIDFDRRVYIFHTEN